MPAKVPDTKVYLYFDQLQVDVTGTIVVMIGRMWDVSAVTGRYLSTNFVVSDAKFHCYLPDKLYLSRSSSTISFDDAEIHTLKTLRLYKNSGAESKNPSLLVDLSQPREWTLENLLILQLSTARKGVTRKLGKFWCDASNTPVDYLVLRYKLELDVSYDTTHVVVVMFDEPTTSLVKCSAESIVEADDKVNPVEGVEDNIGSSTMDAVADTQTPKLKRLGQHPSIPTPLKPSEETKKRVDIEDSNTEASGDSAKGASKDVARVSDMKKRSGDKDKGGIQSDKKKRSDMYMTAQSQSRHLQFGKLDSPAVTQHMLRVSRLSF
ncbi:hypothetical protein Tco_0414340 [Tanacetum coccineum]